MKKLTEEDILQLVEDDPWMMEILRAVEKLNLRDWWIGAGFIRSKVWDYLHSYKDRTLVPDIDIIYFDPHTEPIEDEKRNWKKLKDKKPDISWSLTNIAFRHLRNGRTEAYKSSSEALSEWVETATGIGVKLEQGRPKLSAPNGIDDLVDLIVRPTKTYSDNLEVFNQRIEKKKWLEKWPKLKVVS